MPVSMPRLRPTLTRKSHGVTPLELLFDLVYVFAFTRVTSYISQDPTWEVVTQGLLVLAVLWWTWVGWAWTGNIMRADRGAPIGGIVIAMTAVFLVALSVGFVWDADPGSLSVWCFAGGYLVIRLTNVALQVWGTAEEPALRKRALWTGAAWVPAGVLIVVGALLPADQRLWWWGGTLVIDIVATWVLALRVGSWEVRSPGHLAQRYGQLVIIALGLSIVTVGTVADLEDLSFGVAAVGVVGVLVAVALWWPYFKGIRPSLTKAINDSDAEGQADLARDAYTYMHFPLVLGIVLVAAGVENTFLSTYDGDSYDRALLLVAVGAAVFTIAGAVLMRIAGGHGRWFLGAGIVFLTAVLWLPLLPGWWGIGVAAAILVVVGSLTPGVKDRTSKPAKGKERS